MERHRVQSERRSESEELAFVRTSRLEAAISNMFGGKKGGGLFLPEDFYIPSWSKKEKTAILTPELVKEIAEHAKKRFGSTLKNRPVKKKKRGK